MKLFKLADKLEIKYGKDDFGFTPEGVKIEPPPFETGDLVKNVKDGKTYIWLNIAYWRGPDKSYVQEVGRRVGRGSFQVFPTNELELLKKKKDLKKETPKEEDEAGWLHGFLEKLKK